MSKKYELVIKWTVDDILNRQPDWSKQDAEDFLRSIAESIEDRSIAAGWEVIDEAIEEYHEEASK